MKPRNRTTIESTELLASEEAGGVNRRGFLAIGGALSAAALLAACGSDGSDAGDTSAPLGSQTTTTKAGSETTTTAAGGEMSPEQDLKLGAFAASLEVLAVNTYGAALDAAKKGALGDVPPAVAEFVATAQKQHQAQLDRWNEVLTGAGKDEVTEPPKELEATVNEEFGKVKDVAGAAKLARDLEQIAAATYLSVIPMLDTDD
ncbi:MAG: ferritin-like domain-containing protein, partial [Aquihabitans sp.]